ncbi:MAG: formamidase [Candidatus Babeliales bacterium]
MVKTIITVDVNKKPQEQPMPLHNRWHPDVEPVVTVEPGAVFRIECIDWTGGQIKNDDSAADVKNIDLTQVHYMSGPIAVRGAQPGDLLVVDILDIGALPTNQWGFTGIFAKENGGGFLTDYYPQAHKAIWDIEGIYAQSRHIPGVRFIGLTHTGLMGVAPSPELLARWKKREEALVATNPNRVPPLANLPEKHGALCGTLRGEAADRVAREGARTVPPRENGGNCDISSLTRGSRIYFPVFVKDALLSVGDIHFSQGDGEIAFCGSIETAGWVSLKVDIIKQGAKNYNMQSPLFQSALIESPYTRHLVFEGISVDDNDQQYYLDATVAYRQACLQAIEYLKKFGYSGVQAYALLSAAPMKGRINGIVDIPNACATVALPTDIFTFDILPSSGGAIKQNIKRDLA